MAGSLTSLLDRFSKIDATMDEEEKRKPAPSPAAVSSPVTGFTFDPTPESQPYLSHIAAAEQKYGIPQNLLARMIKQESNFNPAAVSPKGARGIAQIMPQYHPEARPDDPIHSIDYAGRYLRENADRFGGDWQKAVAAYNTGPGNVEQLGMDNLPGETRDYLSRIMGDQAPAPATPMAQPAGVDFKGLADRFESIDKDLDRPEPGMAKTFVQGLARGGEGILSGAGSVGRWLGEVTDVEALARGGKWFSEYWKKAQQEGWEAPDPRIFRGDFMENPSFKRALGIIGEAIPSLFTALGIGVLTGGGAAGAALGAGALGLLEGAPQYEEAREAGKSVGEASTYGAISTAGTALLEFMPLGHFLKGLPGGRLVQGGLGAVEEGVQEVTQTVFQNLVEKIGWNDAQSLFEGIVESFIGGAGAGAIAAPTVSKLNDVLSRNADKLTEEDVDQAFQVAQQNVEAAAENAQRPVEQDLQTWEQSKSVNPMGDDNAARDIINKVAYGQTGAPVSTTPRGGQAEEYMREDMRETGGPDEGAQPTGPGALPPPEGPQPPAGPAPEIDVPAPSDPKVAEFIRGKVEEMGSVDEVDKLYSKDAPVDNYARAYARQLFGESTAIQIEEAGEAQGKETPGTLPSETGKEEFVHDHSSTQINLPEKEAEEIRTFAAKIPDSELYTEEGPDAYGREKEPHVTVRYGMDTLDPAEIAPAFEGLGPITAKMGKVSIFETDKYDVVKVEIDSPALREANKRVGDTVDLPGETFKDYQPHATIAYVKKGEGKKYVGDTSFEGKEITVDEIVLSAKDGRMHPIKLKGTEATSAPSTQVETSTEIKEAPWGDIPGLKKHNTSTGSKLVYATGDGYIQITQKKDGSYYVSRDRAVVGKPIRTSILLDGGTQNQVHDLLKSFAKKQPQTKLEKAHAEYKAFLDGLTPEQREQVKDLIIDAPSVPGIQLRRIQKKLAEKQAVTVDNTGDRPAVQGKIEASKSPTFEYGVDSINEYSDEGAIAKEQFHKDGISHLTRLGKALEGKSLDAKRKSGVHSNRSGIAGGGDIYGEWELSDGTKVSAHLSDSGMQNTPFTPVTKSGVALIVNINNGRNHWLDAKMPLEDLANKIRELAGQEKIGARQAEKQGPDLTVSGQRRNLPGNEDLWYTVHKNPDNTFKVTIGHHSNANVLNIYGAGDTAEKAYERAVARLKKDIREKVEAAQATVEEAPAGSSGPEAANAAPSKPVPETAAEAPSFAIGDTVRPKPGSGISEQNGGKVQHIRRHEDGSEWIKTENTGNMHFAASDWELVSKEGEKPTSNLSILESKEQQGYAARKVAQLLHGLGIHDAIMQGDEYRKKVKNPPYMDLVIERHTHESGLPAIYLTHYYEQNGDLIMDGEMVFTVDARGGLSLAETAVQNVTDGGELRAKDYTFANIFAKNLIAQGFAKAGEQKAETTHAEPAAPNRPYAKVADYVTKRLVKRQPITPQLLFAEANKAFGGSQAEGKYSVKEAYDAMELGVNKWILHNLALVSGKMSQGVRRNTPQEIIAQLKEMMEHLPTQTKRTSEQDEFQQFSTPPPLAYIANWAANIQQGDQYLEPSAGVGGLAVFGRMSHAGTIVVNEIGEYRKKLLMELPFNTYLSEDASQIGNMRNAEHMKDVRPDTVVMNPPFSSTSGRVFGKRDTMEGAKHVEQALKLLKDGGRLVAITGKGMAMDRPAFKDWWSKIKKEYTVRANVGVSGQEYKKYGTTFGNQIIVIDKNGPTVNDVVVGSVEKTEDLIQILQEVRDARTAQSQPDASQPAGQEAPGKTGTAPPQSRPSLLPAAGKVGPSGKQTEPSLASGQPGTAPRPATVSQQSGEGGSVSGGKSRSDRGPAARGDERGPGADDSAAPARPADGGVGELSVTEKQVESRKGEISDSLYDTYKPERLEIPGAKPHPTPLVQSAAMAAVKPPKPAYKPSLPEKTIRGNKNGQGVSDIQIEAVVYAGQAHERKLPDNSRMGYFIGDGTGVGKGREIASIIYDNWNKGRKKAVWISEKASLFNDAKRDVENVIWDSKIVFPQNKTKADSPIVSSRGVLFTTYDTLKSKTKGNNPVKRLDQIVNWLGEDFDGVIAFDESHNMGNAVDQRGTRGVKKASQKALAGLELQKKLPNARVVYVSATGATEVINLAYAQRLGLWGEGMPFANNVEFVNGISAGGIAAMEMVAQDLKAQGKYTARSLSYDGVTYDRVLHNLTSDQLEQYNTMADAWQVVLNNINEALKATGAVDEDGKTLDRNAKSAAMSAFWGAHLRFFSQVITGMQLPSVIGKMKKDLADGKSVVIQLTSTGEAAQERALASAESDEDLEDLDLSPFEGLMQFVMHSFPVAQFEEYMDDNGNMAMRPVKDSNGNIVENADAVAMREALLDRLGAMRGQVAGNPLDDLIEVFGPDNVAEVTGRKRRVITDKETGNKVIEKRSKTKAEADAMAFMAGKKHVLIFSEAGGTGRSYHADMAAANQEKRVHYLLQAGWRADKAVQGLGRTHRSNQAAPPEYYLVTTNLKGQKRFISTIARRLDQLGALTKGSRKTGSQGIFAAKDNLESDHARDALRQFFIDLYVGDIPGLTLQDLEKQTGLKLTDERGNLLQQLPEITQFLNRILSLRVDMQDKVFDAFEQRLERIFSQRLSDGTLNVGVETLKAQSIKKVSEEAVYEDKESGAKTRYIQLDVTQPNRRRAWSEVEEADEFILIKRSGNVWAADQMKSVDPQTGERETNYFLRGPANTSRRVPHHEAEKKIKDGSWEKLNKGQAKGLWQAQYDKLPKTVTYKEHIISGLLLPIWDRLHGHPRLLRIQTDEGEQMIGRRISEDHLAQTLENLGASAAKIDMTPEQVHSNILQSNFKIKLANDWELKRSRVSDENRIEIKGISWGDFQNLAKHGVFHERISWQTRYFVPSEPGQGAEALKAIMLNRPIVKAQPPAATRYQDERLAGGATRLSMGAAPGTDVTRRAINASSAAGVKNLTRVSEVVMRAIRTSGIGQEALDRISVELKPVIDLRGKNVEQTVAQWTARNQNISAILGATTINNLKAVVELSLEQDLSSMEKTAYHEAFHLAAAWVLPKAEYDRLMTFYKGNEETAADAFVEYMQGRSSATGLVRRALYQLREFFRALGSALRGQGFTTPDKIFGDLSSGKYAAGQQRGEGTKVSFKGQQMQPVDINSPAFKDWFAGSKVVDDEGKPAVYYHGTEVEFDAFRTSNQLGAHFGTTAQANQFGEYGKVLPVYLNIKKPLRLEDRGSFFPSLVIPQLQELGILPSGNLEDQFYKEGANQAVQRAIKEAGYDGIIYLNRREGSHDPFGPDGVDGDELNAMSDDEVLEMFPDAEDSYIVFEPTQVKSALTNTGEFSPTNPSIRFKAVTESKTLLKAAENDPIHQTATLFNRAYPGHQVRYDGIQEGWGKYPDTYQFTAMDGPAKGATFNVKEAKPSAIRAKLDEMVAMRQPKTQLRVGDKPGKDVAESVFPSEVAKNVKASRGITGQAGPIKERVTEWIKEAIATFTPGNMFPTLKGPAFAKANEILRHATEIPNYSKWKAVQDLKEIINPKELTPRQYDLFTYSLVLDDMLYDIETPGRPLYDWQKEHGELPFGFKSVEEVQASIAKVKARVAADEKVQEALKRREEHMRDLRRKLVDAKLLNPSVLEDPRYFHHQVLEYANIKHGTGTSSRDLRVHKKGYQIHRTGSIKAYNTEYMEAEFEVLAQGIAQLEMKQDLDEIGDNYNIIAGLRAAARKANYIAIVGGKDNYDRLLALRAQKRQIDPEGNGKGLDKEQRAALKAINDEIWKLDPTMPFRQKIAIGMGKLKKAYDLDGIEPGTEGFAEISRLADEGDPSALQILRAVNDRKQFIQTALGAGFQTWQSLMEKKTPLEGSAGWTNWKPRPGTAWYVTNTLNDRLIEQVLAGEKELEEKDVRKVLARGYDVEWVIPAELAEVLDGADFLKTPSEHVIAKAAEQTLNWWKRWILINPFRIVKYNLNNLSGDLDIALAYDAKILTYAKQAAVDLWKMHRGKDLSRELKAEMNQAMRDGVIGSGMTVHDIPDVKNLAEFDQLMSAMRADKSKSIDYIKRFWNNSKNFTTWRENILRLAAYRHFQAEIKKGKRVYGASRQAEVDATTDPDRRAALLARELIGDYGRLSKGGQWLRKKLIPFASWMEINAPRYWRIFKNLPVEGEKSGARLKLGAVLGKKAAFATAKMAMLYAMVQIFNHMVWPDEEEELGESGRRQMHLILGRRPDGSIMTLRIQGAFSDALSWFGAEDIPEDLREVRSGRKPWHSLLSEAVLAPAQKFVQGLRPDIKTPMELATGKQLYPDFTRPRPIRDKMEHLSRVFSMEPLYRHLAGKPAKGDGLVEQIVNDLANTFTYSADPGEQAYYSARSMVFDYMRQNSIEQPAVDPTDKSNALYYYKRSVQYGDTEAAMRYLKRYRDLGGSIKGMRISVDRAHPLAALPRAHRMRFMAWANADGRRTVGTAINWYNQVYRGGGSQ